ncbi:hypothetical protein [Undibacterium terreum]|uniref:Uncharacterized protein n=1 Tax=Undibacterium terreum TaxID=1224302 RepID=A0A916V131_9BURK|nr:hypothetical protein [Undibacterium terreum]GGD00967.1 hypothetical protein GCM10011396_55700 [Undibacterium terreum]
MQKPVSLLALLITSAFGTFGAFGFTQASAADGAANGANGANGVLELRKGTFTVVTNEVSTASAPGIMDRRLEVRSFDAAPIQLAALADVPSPTQIETIVSTAMSEALSSAPLLPGGKVVKNAPYSTEVVSERIQTLADGNQIGSKTSTMSYRDAQGRTRQEIRDGKGEVRQVIINDAVEGTRYMLNPSSKTAFKISVDKDFARRIEEAKAKAEVARAKAEIARKEGKLAAAQSEGGGQEIIVKRSEKSSDTGKDAAKGPDGKDVREEVRVKVIRLNADKEEKLAANLSSLNTMGASLGEMVRMGPIYNAFGDAGMSSKSTKKDLGSKDFDGIKAEGKMSSYSIPAGQIGNKNPITVSTETWYSPELQVTVYSKHSDPRTGDLIYRLANLKRGEPSSALFTVPDSYSIKESPAQIHINEKRVEINSGKK